MRKVTFSKSKLSITAKIAQDSCHKYLIHEERLLQPQKDDKDILDTKYIHKQSVCMIKFLYHNKHCMFVTALSNTVLNRVQDTNVLSFFFGVRKRHQQDTSKQSSHQVS